MKVQIGDKVYCATEEPIIIVLSDIDKENIKNMIKENYLYAGFPDTWDVKDIKGKMQKLKDAK